MKVQVQRWGNSLALRIPKSLAIETHISNGSEVELSLVDGKLIIEPIVEPTFSLDELLAGVTETNLHSAVETGGPVGNEAW